MTDKDRQQKILELIADETRNCNLCPLARCRIKSVPGSGSHSSSIVFIGEAPGANEDKQGVPFVGAAGKFLDEMLEGIGMKRSDIYITNIVKCRPPNNRDPFPDEADICTEHYLWRQLEAIKPKLIATLGRHAMYRFIPSDKKISDVHGKLFKLKSPKSGKSFNILPLYHPAAALYNGSMRDVLKKDFKNVQKILRETS